MIVGSDQVWRAPYNIHTLFDMYLNFLKDLPVKRIAYAASFGTDNLNEYSSRQIDKCKSLLKRFDLITVRESTGVTICTKYFGVHATHVLDPTMLLTKTDYLKLCKTIPVKDSNFIAAYILDMSKYKNDILQKIRKKHNLRIIEFSVNHKPALSVERWLSIFRDARYVVTDSYHGIAFSIIFNKPFYAIANDNRGNTRVNSLLSSFNLTDKSDTNINWEEINSIHKKLREHSKTILYNSLNTKNNFKSSMVVHNISK